LSLGFFFPRPSGSSVTSQLPPRSSVLRLGLVADVVLDHVRPRVDALLAPEHAGATILPSNFTAAASMSVPSRLDRQPRHVGVERFDELLDLVAALVARVMAIFGVRYQVYAVASLLLVALATFSFAPMPR
jgi:hypothetical protein